MTAARQQANEIVAAARRQAADIVGQAERQAGEAAAAGSEAERIVTEYQEKATSLDLARAQVEEQREILALERARLEDDRKALAAERSRSAPTPASPATPWLTPSNDDPGQPDPVDAIFEDVDEITAVSDDDRAAAARASLFKRRGTLLPQE